MSKIVRLSLLGGIAVSLIALQRPIANLPAATVQERTDSAVVYALEFLARQQLPNGSWQADFGPSNANTSLAIMSFLAAGHAPSEGPYANHIRRGIRFVLSQQRANGMFSDHVHGPMYAHGITTLMLAEVVGMLDEPQATECREALRRGVKLILASQDVPKAFNDRGGWRYHPGSNDSDLSVTVWQLMALRAAQNVGCDIPVENIDEAIEYVKKCHNPFDGGFCYRPREGSSPTRTGTGILALEICGAHHTNEALNGADYLLRHPLDPRQHFYYYGVYYCTLGMFQIGGEYWTRTHEQIIPQILGLQRLDGSWFPTVAQENTGGVVYCTAMSVLALCVEYQYLPIYQK